MWLPVKQLLSQAESLAATFQQGGETRYIDEAIVLDREALDICTPSHPQRSDCLIQLSFHISTRFNQLGGIEKLNEAIILDREALALRTPGYPDRSMSLNNLALHLCTRYEQVGRITTAHHYHIIFIAFLSGSYS